MRACFNLNKGLYFQIFAGGTFRFELFLRTKNVSFQWGGRAKRKHIFLLNFQSRLSEIQIKPDPPPPLVNGAIICQFPLNFGKISQNIDKMTKLGILQHLIKITYSIFFSDNHAQNIWSKWQFLKKQTLSFKNFPLNMFRPIYFVHDCLRKKLSR